jgi:hypothetical protein
MGGGGLPRLAAPRGVGDRWPDSPQGAGVERSSCQRFAAGGHRGRAGSPDRDEKGLEGERSPWKDGVQFRRQRRGLGHQLGCGATPRSRRNGTGATTAVTRQGCDRAMFFEGCEPRRGDRYGVRAGSKDLVRPPEREKRDEPHDRLRDATSPRAPSGANRRGRVKRRGRNRIDRLAACRPMPRGEPSKARFEAGVDARSRCRWRGEEPHERRPLGESGQGFGRIALERSEDHAGPHVTLRGAARTSGHPRGPAARAARPRRARESQDPAAGGVAGGISIGGVSIGARHEPGRSGQPHESCAGFGPGCFHRASNL